MKKIFKSVLWGALATFPFSLATGVELIPPGLEAYTADLHLHGHSNHNAGSQPASMEYHSTQASVTGLANILWWTDHTRLFDQWRAFSFDTSASSVDPDTLDILNLSSSGTASATYMAARLTSGGTPTAIVESGIARLQIQSDPDDQDYQFLEYTAGNGGTRFGTIVGFGFNRPLTSEPIATVQIECLLPNSSTVCEIEFRLAWHHVDNEPVQQVLIYRIKPGTIEKNASLLDRSRVLINLPENNTGEYQLDLLQDAQLLDNGDDNTVNGFSVRIGAKLGSTATANFQGLTLISRKPSDVNQIESIRMLAERYEDIFDLAEPIGLEFGTEEGHINGFLPRSLDGSDTDLFDLEQGQRQPLNVTEWTSRVHSRNGIVSLNHPFGPGTGCGTLMPDDCVRERAETLIGNNSFDADLLEVGYINRGLPLQSHLDLWDMLTANGVLLYGTGVSDNHGVPWSQLPNHLTWILSPSRSTADLLDALKSGKTYFGNPKAWQGKFFFKVGEALMGDRIPNPGGSGILQIQLDPWPETVSLYLIQGLVQPGLTVEFLHNRTAILPGETVLVDLSQPSFIRLEALEEIGNNEGISIFSNPIVFLEDPATASGLVYYDRNNDGIFNLDDQPVPDARVILRYSGENGSFEENGDDTFTNAFTLETGSYLFNNLATGDYRISSVAGNNSSIPPDAVLTSSDSVYNITLANGETISGLDFGFSVAGSKPVDSDQDGTPPESVADINKDGLSDSVAVALGLDPAAQGGDTDGDGLADIVEIGGDTLNPVDSDLDGIIDALEPGIASNDASIASNLRLPSGNASITISAPSGSAISNATSDNVTDVINGVNALFGSISYEVTSAVANTVPIRMSLSEELPDKLALYKETESGVLTLIPNNIWLRIDKNTVEVNLTDGDSATDLDRTANGIIVDPIVFAIAPATSNNNSGNEPTTSGGGGGCSLATDSDAAAKFDQLILLTFTILLLLIRIGCRVK